MPKRRIFSAEFKAKIVLDLISGAKNAATTFAYDNIGLRTQKALPNGVTTNYSYDTLNRLTDINQQKGGATLASYAYLLDAAGNRLGVTEADGSSIRWTYDDSYRLTNERRFNGANELVFNADFTYDPAGNRLSQNANGSTTNYTYNELDQLLTAGPIHYQYDLRGNLAKVINGSQISQYHYDAQNRMVGVSLFDGTNITNTYDAYGRRVQQSIDPSTSSGQVSQVTNYLWDEVSPYGDVVLETGAGNATSYVLAGSELLSQTRNGVTSYYLQDGQGSTRGLANSAGSVTDTYAYTAFGETLSHIGTTVNSYQYTGQQFDGLTGLYSLRSRYYAPNIGRFLSQDTYAINFSNPVELNRYVYAANNPTNYTDPSGQTVFTGYSVQTSQSARNSVGLSLLAKRILLPATILAVFALWLVLTPTGPVVPDVTKPETSDEAADRYIREFYERYPQLDSSGCPSGLPKWAKILIAVLVGTQTGGDTVKVRPTPQPPQPTPTPQTPFIVRHFTSRNRLSGIRSQGYTIIPTYPAFPGQGAVFFTDTSPFNGGFDRYMISATLGIDYEKTESFIDIDHNKVGNQASWFSRLMNGRIEYYYLTNLPLTVVNGFIREGDVSELP